VHLKDDELVSGLAESVQGDPLLAATYARVHTPASFAHWLGPLGNYLIARPAARAEAKKMTEQSDVPLDSAVVLGISGEALHLWSADPMLNQVHDYLGHVPRARISGMHATPGKSWQKLTINLEGGHDIELEARGASHALVAAFEAPAGPAQ